MWGNILSSRCREFHPLLKSGRSFAATLSSRPRTIEDGALRFDRSISSGFIQASPSPSPSPRQKSNSYLARFSVRCPRDGSKDSRLFSSKRLLVYNGTGINLSSASVRCFGVSSSTRGRHWFDTLRDDDDLDKRFNDPLYTKGSSNPKPFEMELEMKAYRLEQEEKYRSFRPLLVLYVLVGCISGYVACDSYREAKKLQKRTKWMTPEAGEKLTPFLWASAAILVVYIFEFCEAGGTLGAHVPFYTLGCFFGVYAAKYIYHEVKDFLLE